MFKGMMKHIVFFFYHNLKIIINQININIYQKKKKSILKLIQVILYSNLIILKILNLEFY